jgi:hypothetical protein
MGERGADAPFAAGSRAAEGERELETGGSGETVRRCRCCRRSCAEEEENRWCVLRLEMRVNWKRAQGWISGLTVSRFPCWGRAIAN